MRARCFGRRPLRLLPRLKLGVFRNIASSSRMTREAVGGASSRCVGRV